MLRVTASNIRVRAPFFCSIKNLAAFSLPLVQCSLIKLPELQNQPVRDLAYSCFSEPLVSDFSAIAGRDAPLHCSLQLTSKRLNWLMQLDENPQLLLNFLDQLRPRRLGLYHEALWQFFLQQDDEVELITQNAQAREAGRTIGEFDIIYRDLAGDRFVHLELAYKFYLQAAIQEEPGLAQWLGPNVNDRLDLKLDHMLIHQSQLSRIDAGRQLLESLGIPSVERQISLRGYLLFRLAQQANSVLPAALNPDLQRGLWLPLSELIPRLDQFGNWIELSRLHWMSPGFAETTTIYKPTDFAAYLQQHFEQSEASIMVSGSNRSRTAQASDCLRIMVTADNWPSLSRT